MRGGPADQSLRGWCRADRCSGRASRSRSPRLTPSSSPSRVRMRVRMRSSTRASPHHRSPVLWRETNTAPSAACSPILRRIACQPGGVRNEPSAPPMPFRAVDTGHAATGFSAFEPSGDLTLGVDHEQPVGQARRRALAREAVARKIERAGGREFVESRPSRAHSATAAAGGVTPFVANSGRDFRAPARARAVPICEL